jgi:hypothetical protein
MTQIMTAPEVRHVRSPWSLRSGGHGLRASMKNGSATGAIYPYPCKTSIPSFPKIFLLNSEFERCRPETELVFSLKNERHSFYLRSTVFKSSEATMTS